MKIVLKENVEKLGKKGEIKEVKDGFARNYLFPRNLAVIATPAIIKKAREEEKRRAKLEEELRNQARKKVKILEAEKFVIQVKAGASGKLFGAIQPSDIAQIIEKQAGIKIHPKIVEISEPIKKIGDYKIKIALHKNVTANISLKVVAQG